jgi:hypothetical protein
VLNLGSFQNDISKYVGMSKTMVVREPMSWKHCTRGVEGNWVDTKFYVSKMFEGSPTMYWR